MQSINHAPEQLDKQEVKQKVKNMYREVALHPEVTYHFEMGRMLAERLGYPAEALNNIPPAAIDSFAGVGYYFDFANIQKGETVIDLGSGSGMDVFFAANQVGKSGKVTGIDMTSEQLFKAKKLSEEYSFSQVDFRKGYIENLPVDASTADAVISNGVINLSVDKAKVFREAARVLKKGGRFIVADIVTSVRLPESISCNATLWAACIGGAMQKDEYKNLIEKAGLKLIRHEINPYEFLSNSAKRATKDFGISSISLLAEKL